MSGFGLRLPVLDPLTLAFSGEHIILLVSIGTALPMVIGFFLARHANLRQTG